MRRFLLIRHGKTRSNMERRYIGADEPLCGEGIRGVLASRAQLPPITALLSAPALRCRQTAELLFPDIPYALCPLRETDFGMFSGKNADDLIGNREYEQWLETNCTGDIPGGDSVAAFKQRCCEAFLNIAEESGEGTTALVIHGGNIMAILERFALPKQDFYAYHIPNCGFFSYGWEGDHLMIEKS